MTDVLLITLLSTFLTVSLLPVAFHKSDFHDTQPGNLVQASWVQWEGLGAKDTGKSATSPL